MSIKITEPIVCRCREQLTLTWDVEAYSLAECSHGNRWVFTPSGGDPLWTQYHGRLRSFMIWTEARIAGVKLPR